MTLTLDQALDALPLVAILRADRPERLPEAIGVLADSGIRAVEVALTTPGALEVLREVTAGELADRVAFGAGTVLTPAALDDALAAGAGYAVTPAVVTDVLAHAHALQVPVVCGAWSASEALQAVAGGAGWVKLFPAAAAGPGYLRALRAPLPGLRWVPTGGVTVEQVPEWFAAGASAVAVGGPLQGDAAKPGSDLDALRRRAIDLVSAVGRSVR